jgi:hypothetical protein
MDIHAEVGMQCADCHFAQDSHGNGFIYGEVANAIEIGCKDCHGTSQGLCEPAHLQRRRAAARHNLELLRNENGQRRFEWMQCRDAQQNEQTLFELRCPRSPIPAIGPDPALDHRSRCLLGVSQVKDSVTASCPLRAGRRSARQAAPAPASTRSRRAPS